MHGINDQSASPDVPILSFTNLTNGFVQILDAKFETFFKAIFIFMKSNKRSRGTLKGQEPSFFLDAPIK